MKKFFSILTLSLTFFLVLKTNQTLAGEGGNAQLENYDSTQKANSDLAKPEETSNFNDPLLDSRNEPSFTQKVKKRFIEGGVFFMIWVLACLILGIATAIERIIYLSLSNVNTKKVLQQVEEALNNGGVEVAKEVCRNTRGPVGSIFYDGLVRSDEGIEQVEKAVIAGGSVQMGLMEKGVSWISLFIALAPMLGFLGTVLGMIGAFDSIAEAGGIEASAMAGDIKMALITTVAGLIVAIILQVFYNIVVAKIDNLVNQMEDASNAFIKIVQNNIGTIS
jgi:biopolymer transport protein ExbB